VTGHRTRGRWYTTQTEPSFDDITIKLRRVIIAARFRSQRLEQQPRKKPGPSSPPGQPPGLDSQICETRGVWVAWVVEHCLKWPLTHAEEMQEAVMPREELLDRMAAS
jgi:hypothetical protein